MASASNVCSLVSRLVLRRGISRQPAWALRSSFCTAAPQPPTTDGAAQSSMPPETDELQKQITQLQGQLEDLDDKYKRSLADRENVRTRLEKQVQDSKLFGIQSFCKDLLEVADILGKATESVPPEEITDTNPHLKSLFQGLKMTEAQLTAVFKRHGVQVINPVGEKFDPHRHDALFQQAVEGFEPGHVCVVTKLGYSLHERTIRPALVGVAKAP